MPNEATEPPKVKPEYLQPIVDDLWKKGIRGENNVWKVKCRLEERQHGGWDVMFGWDAAFDGTNEKVPLEEPADVAGPEKLGFWWIRFRSQELEDVTANFVDYPEPPREPWVERDDSRWKALIKRESENQMRDMGYPRMVRLMSNDLALAGACACNACFACAKTIEELETELRAMPETGEDKVRDLKIRSAKQVVGARREYESRLSRLRNRTTITGPLAGGGYKAIGIEPEGLAEELFLYAASAGAHFEQFIKAGALGRGYSFDSGRGGGSKKPRPPWLPEVAKALDFPATAAKFFEVYEGNALAKKGTAVAEGIYYVLRTWEEDRANLCGKRPEEMTEDELKKATRMGIVGLCGKRLEEMTEDELKKAKIDRRYISHVALGKWLTDIASEQSG